MFNKMGSEMSGAIDVKYVLIRMSLFTFKVSYDNAKLVSLALFWFILLVTSKSYFQMVTIVTC